MRIFHLGTNLLKNCFRLNFKIRIEGVFEDNYLLFQDFRALRIPKSGNKKGQPFLIDLLVLPR